MEARSQGTNRPLAVRPRTPTTVPTNGRIEGGQNEGDGRSDAGHRASTGHRGDGTPPWGQLAREVEDLRRALMSAVQAPTDLRREDVLALSQRLDDLIVRAQQALAERRPARQG